VSSVTQPSHNARQFYTQQEKKYTIIIFQSIYN